MSGPEARYAFLPWLRRGISAAAGAGAALDRRLRVPIEISFGEGRGSSVALQMVGPGDVIGLDRRVVARTWPRANVHDAEPNFFPMVEFDQADLPWRYSPAVPPADGRLQPWLCLIVLTDEEVGEQIPPSATRPLTVVEVTDAPLPLMDQAWAWAHAQVSGSESVTPADAAALLSDEPHRLIARLLCPRRLDPQTRYTALVVPTFESGRRAGLGLPADDAADPMAPAWASDTRSIQLPVYYQWSFTTGATGDFEELVKRLAPVELPATVGVRAMDVGDPGAQLPAASGESLDLEGALRSRAAVRTPWPDADRGPFVAALGDFLNRPTDLLGDGTGVRAVSAPLYGRWYAAQDHFAPGQEPAWFQEVNGDPRWRVAAGLGAQVVQANQRQLMASAWQQASGLSEVNDALRLAQLSRELAVRVHERHLAASDDELVLQLTAPLHARVRASPITIAARLRDSPIAEGLLSSGWRRVARPLGPIGRRQGRKSGERSDVVARVNREELSPAPPPPTPEAMATPSRAGRDIVPAWADARSVGALRTWVRRLPLIGGIALVLAAIALAAGAALGIVAVLALAGGAAVVAAAPLRRVVDRLETRLAVRDGALTPRTLEAVPARPDFVVSESELVGGASPPPQPAPPAVARRPEDSPAAHAFRLAAAAMLERTTSDIVAPPQRQAVALRELRETLLTKLDPRTTIGARLRERLRVADHLRWQPADPLEPVQAGPDFPQPMYRYLAELSQDWLLPGLDGVPSNTVSLAETNQAFVEAFMLGLNHEMGTELLWQEYPADQRRTFFRQFWDPAGFVPPAGQTRDPETLKDIRPIHHWPPTASLGGNSPRTTATDERLVLLIRGDVVHRYPTLTVYAARAVIDELGDRVPGTEEQQPVFRGGLEPDVAFFGFPLSEAQVRGSGTPGVGDQGWFFILQEHTSEPRFGLDTGEAGAAPPATWNDLSWGQLATAAEGLSAIDYIDLDAELPDTSAITDPPAVAWHGDAGLGAHGTHAGQTAFITLQRPMRVAVHGTALVPSHTP